MTNTKSRLSNRHGDLREALIKYALESARSGTIDDLSLRKASRVLGVSPGAAYKHFEDRDALMGVVAQRGFDALAEEFESVLPFESSATSVIDAKTRFYAIAEKYVSFAEAHYGLWRLMFGPYGLSPHDDDERPSTYSWLEKSLMELQRFDLIASASPQARFFAWTSIHGLSDLQASPAIADSPDWKPIEAQCDYIIAALANMDFQSD